MEGSRNGWGEALDVVRASERVTALAGPLTALVRDLDRVLELAPYLAPELGAVKARMGEAVDHVVAAQAVLSAKLDMIMERM